MKTQKEIETIKNTCDTSKILLKLFKKYNDYDSTLFEHYDPNSLFANRKKINVSSNIENNSVAIIKYKEPLFKRILNKLKILFNNK